MRYLAIDYGLRRLGLAHCDPGETIVSPLCQLLMPAAGSRKVIEQLVAIIKENQIEAVVIGLPLNMDGSAGPQAQKTKIFAGLLSDSVDIPVHLQDERLSSATADYMLDETGFTNKQRKARRDMLAACDILHEFLGRY